MRKIKIISWNVNGLRSVFTKGLPEYLAAERPDVLCLQEIKIQPEQLGEIDSLESYGEWHLSSAQKKGYSGVATLLRSEISGDFKLKARGIGRPEFDSEGRVLVLEHPEFLLYNIYFPSGTSGEERQGFKYDFLSALNKHILALSEAERQKLIILGDVNICHREIDIHHPEEATKKKLTGFLPEERAWFDQFLELGFVDSFRLLNGDKPQQYSWWSFRARAREKNLGWRIDYILVAEALKSRVSAAWLSPQVLGSDHCPIGIELLLT